MVAHRRINFRRLVAPGVLMVTAIMTVTLCLPVQARAPYEFDQSGYLGEAALLPDWADTMQRHQQQSPALDACMASEDTCPSYYKGLRALLLKAENLSAIQQIKLVNYYVNRKRYRNDTSATLDTDLTAEPVKYRSRWSTVEEFMQRGGDCEDYATTKYYLLRRLGFDVDTLRVVVTWDRKAHGYHAVLAIRHEGEVLLLESDNVIRRGTSNAYRFIYSVNEHAIWDHETASRISRQTPQQIPQHREETPA